MTKHVLGEEYLFYIRTTDDGRRVILNRCAVNEVIEGEISEDYKKIQLINPLTLKGYGEPIGGLAGYGKPKEKTITELKLSKENSRKLQDYIELK